MNQLAQQIRVLRTAKNLSQDELAEIFGVSLDYLVLGKEPEKEIVVEQRGKMNVWEYLNEETKRQLTRGDFVFLILFFIVFLCAMFIKHYF
ncbi:TPA: helix-turn-helix domain-containing protein [Streptococcus suis]|nr:helix-turn-helix domain-containing protein [Streptococcus suis]